MSIAREGKFLVARALSPWPMLGIESEILEACVAEAAGYQGVFGSSAFGFNESTLDCVRTLPDLKSIWFWDVELENVDALYGLRSLESFGVHPRRPAVDFSRLPTLKRLVIEHRPKDCGLESLSRLELLHLWRYAPKSKSFHDLHLPASLTELQINWCSPGSLAGLPVLPNVTRLEIHRCRNFDSAVGLAEQFPNLEHLVIDACGKMDPAAAKCLPQQLPRLKHAVVQRVKLV